MIKEYLEPRKCCKKCIYKKHNICGKTDEIKEYCKIFSKFKANCERKIEIEEYKEKEIK